MVSGVRSAYAEYSTYAHKPVASHTEAAKSAQASGITTVSWAEVMAGTAPTASFVVCDSQEDQAALQAYLSQGSSNIPSRPSEDYVNLSTALTDEEWESLSQKYDPSNMTRQEYDALLTELHGMGLLSDRERDMLSVCEDGHSSCINVGGIHLSRITPEMLNGHVIASLTNNNDFPYGQPVGFASGKAYCDVFALSAWEQAFQYYDQNQSEWIPTRKAQAFQWLNAILQEMVSHK